MDLSGKMMIIVWCFIAWIHGATVGASLGDSMLNRLFWMTICISIPSFLVWPYATGRRLVVAFLYLLGCTYLNVFMSTVTWYRNPRHLQRLPDLGHDLMPMLGEVNVPFLDAPVDLTHIPDVFIGVAVGLSAVFTFVHNQRWVICRRFFVIYGSLMFLRSITIVVTNLPDSSPMCERLTPGTVGWLELDVRQLVTRSVQLLIPIGVTTCGDMVFSGHSTVLVLCAMTWHTYYKWVPESVNTVKFSFWCLVACGLLSIVATRLHYTLDVLLAIYLTITVWVSYHRLAKDVQLGHRFITVWAVDGMVIYPAVEWLEGNQDAYPDPVEADPAVVDDPSAPPSEAGGVGGQSPGGGTSTPGGGPREKIVYDGSAEPASSRRTSITSVPSFASLQALAASFRQGMSSMRKGKGGGDGAVLPNGDIIKVKSGDKIPADVRLVKVAGFKVDNASLTGENEPQVRTDKPTDVNPLESKNLAFYATLANEGSATGLVINTGDNTVIGRIANLMQDTENEDTPIHIEINHFIKIITAVAIFLGVTFFVVGLALGTPIISNLVFAIGIIVANVPEGLLATVTVSLSLTAQSMAKKKVLVKHLEAVETLGSTSAIASDKTGTLTQNKMTVANLFYGSKLYSCEIPGTDVVKEWDEDNSDFQDLMRIATLCNNAFFLEDENKKLLEENPKAQLKDFLTEGDASESALIKFCQPVRDILEHRAASPRVGQIPFNSKNKWQISINEQEDSRDDDRYVMLMKGAPERILSYCDKVLVNGKEKKLDSKFQKAFDEATGICASRGERILGFCHVYLSAKKHKKGFEFNFDEPNFQMENLVFVGFMTLFDPPRPTVPVSVDLCLSAGIRVIMVTGDHPETAKAIARKVHIINSQTYEDLYSEYVKENGEPSDDDARNDVQLRLRGEAKAIVVTGTMIEDLTEEDWDFILAKPEVVFARTSPKQKLIIVEHLQDRGHVVAVTGDGVNDSPALRKADIGVAMGIMGTEVAKEAADMILLNDNFSSIVIGVREGRIIFDNLKKSIAYTLSSNIPEISPFLSFITMGFPLPLSTVLILCVDLGTDMLPAISLAYERHESNIMKRKPRRQGDRLVNTRLISFSYFQIGVFQALAGFFVYLVVMGDHGFPPWILTGEGVEWSRSDDLLVRGHGVSYRDEALKTAQTAFFVSIVIVQWADVMACKTRLNSLFQQGMKNWILNLGLFEETALCILLCYVPFFNQIFGTRWLRWYWWIPPLPFSFAILVYDEMRKALIRKGSAEPKDDDPKSAAIFRWAFEKTYY